MLQLIRYFQYLFLLPATLPLVVAYIAIGKPKKIGYFFLFRLLFPTMLKPHYNAMGAPQTLQKCALRRCLCPHGSSGKLVLIEASGNIDGSSYFLQSVYSRCHCEFLGFQMFISNISDSII